VVALPISSEAIDEATTATEAPTAPLLPDGWRPLGQLTDDERASIFQAAQHGDAEALRQVLWSLALEPDRGAKLLDLPTQIRRTLIEAYADPRNGLMRKLTEAQCEMVRADLLASCGGTPLERLLVDRIVTCWLAAYLADGSAAVGGKYASSSAEYYIRRQDRAHRRFLQSIEALARVQRLLRPGPLLAMAQLNIAQAGSQQLTIATPYDAPGARGAHQRLSGVAGAPKTHLRVSLIPIVDDTC